MFSRPKILFLVSLLFVALLNPKLNPYLLFKFLIFYHSSRFSYYRYLQVNNSPLVTKMYGAYIIADDTLTCLLVWLWHLNN